MINVDTTSGFEKTNQNCGSSVVGIYLVSIVFRLS